ncbi:hypothetical protein Tco_0196429 [Tanacetum coccineum]
MDPTGRAMVVTTTTTTITTTLAAITGVPVLDTTKGTEVSNSTDLPVLIPSSLGYPLRVILTLFVPRMDVDTQESVVMLLVLASNAARLVIFSGIARRTLGQILRLEVLNHSGDPSNKVLLLFGVLIRVHLGVILLHLVSKDILSFHDSSPELLCFPIFMSFAMILYMFDFKTYSIARAIYTHDHDLHDLPPSHGGTMTVTHEAPVGVWMHPSLHVYTFMVIGWCVLYIPSHWS